MTKVRGLFDLDGVIVDLLPGWRDEYNKKYDDNLTIEEMFSSWNVENNVKPEAVEDIYNMLDTAELYASLNPIEGAIEGMQKLHESGKFEIHLVTAFMGKGGVADGKCQWIANHLPFVHRDNIILAHDKELVYGDFLVDDSEKNLIKWINFQEPLNSNASAIMMEAPHNKDFDMTDPEYADIDKVSDWAELSDYLFSVVA